MNKTYNTQGISLLTDKELTDVIGKIQREAYEECKPFMDELGKRYQKQKKLDQENLKKVS